jgi:hypothetical protein
MSPDVIATVLTGVGIVLAVWRMGEGVRRDLSGQIAGVRRDLSGQIAGVSKRVDAVEVRLSAEIAAVNTRIDNILLADRHATS